MTTVTGRFYVENSLVEEQPDDHLKITFQGQPRELFLSFLRLNSALRVISNANNLGLILIDPDIGENLVKVAVAPDKGTGSMFDVELRDGDISMADYDAILLWMQDHLASFFVRRFQQAQEKAAKLEPLVTALNASTVG